jgi:hypothetical protein
MHLPFLLFRSTLVLLALALVSQAARALDCEELRSAVEARIRAHGVKSFTVAVVDADAKTTGRAVGSCELGSKKLVYAQRPDQAAPGPSSAPVRAIAPARPKAEVITECADGRVITQGNCKR